MRIRSITFLFIVFLLLSSLAVPVIASGCDPECEGCQTCNEGVCEDDDSKCDTENCYECVSGDCEYQCPSGQFCCDGECCETGARCCPDGSCASCCLEVENETTCSSANNIPCIACVGVLGDCSAGPMTRIYTNASLYDCIAGCPGDCPDDFEYIACYRVYLCKTGYTYNFQECCMGGEIPQPLDCYNADHPWWCNTCVPDYDSLFATVNLGHKRCGPGT